MNRKFNIIDFIIIFFIIVAIILVGLFYFNITKDKGASIMDEQPKTKLNFTVEVTNITENIAQMYKEGQTVKFDNYGKCEGVIQKVVIEPYKIWTKNTEIGEFLITEVPNKYVAKITIQTDVTKEENKYSCQEERISIGKSLPLKTKGVACESCYIVDLYEVE